MPSSRKAQEKGLKMLKEETHEALEIIHTVAGCASVNLTSMADFSSQSQHARKSPKIMRCFPRKLEKPYQVRDRSVGTSCSQTLESDPEMIFFISNIK